MASGLLKFATLGGMAASGGGIVAGASMMSGSKQGVSDIKKASAPEEADFAQDTESETQEQTVITPKEKNCVVYEMEAPVGSHNSREFKTLKARFDTKDSFFGKLSSLEKKLWNEDELRREIGKVCEKYEQAYIWWGTSSNKESTWIYSEGMNSGKDWSKEVRIPETLKR
ncbi:hypothetical protein MHF_1090 [Mycoplasma haemofelis Ohio2]|uniref:Uncharacterized protein n=1 Tax=Mycoplasma haemofelis (strain Ohio2) TaxID=859194 RepID=F6FJI3_MYCHI|nr:hypothetical protein MHF_1090 [Mycoplasma haemofelis Ohio2]